MIIIAVVMSLSGFLWMTNSAASEKVSHFDPVVIATRIWEIRNKVLEEHAYVLLIRCLMT